jgi:hypothetical protein
MNSNPIKPILFVLLILWIGTLSPSDGVDGPVYKEATELIVTATLIVTTISLGAIFLKRIGRPIH